MLCHELKLMNNFKIIACHIKMCVLASVGNLNFVVVKNNFYDREIPVLDR